MLILRSIPFSFAILWRMALVMPFVVLALAVFSAMFVIWFLTSMLFFPSVALMIITTVLLFPMAAFLVTLAVMSAMMSVVPTMVGARLGLQARGVIVKDGYGKMVLPALGYGLFESLLGIILMSAGFGLFLLMSPLSLADLSQLADEDSQQVIVEAFAGSAQYALPIILGVSMIMIAVRALLLVPLAGASIGQDANGSMHTPFMGAGTRYLSVLCVVILAGVASFFIAPFLAFAGEVIGLGDAQLTALETAGAGEDFTLSSIWTWQLGVLFALAILSWIWIFCLQCAVAVLAYLDKKDEYDEIRNAEVEVKRMAAEEVRGLWKERMPPGRR